jgi:hypothetical protein
MSQASTSALCMVHACCLLGLIFDPEDGGVSFLWNVSELAADCMATHFQKIVLLM